MSAEVRVDLPTVKAAIDALGAKKRSQIIAGTASTVRGEIVKRWGQSKGADNSTLPKISDPYSKLKAAAGRNAVIDLNLGGGLIRSFGVKKISADGNEATISFSGDSLSPVLTPKGVKGQEKKDNIKIARYLVGRMPGIMRTDGSLQRMAVKAYNVILRKMIGFQR